MTIIKNWQELAETVDRGVEVNPYRELERDKQRNFVYNWTCETIANKDPIHDYIEFPRSVHYYRK